MKKIALSLLTSASLFVTAASHAAPAPPGWEVVELPPLSEGTSGTNALGIEDKTGRVVGVSDYSDPKGLMDTQVGVVWVTSQRPPVPKPLFPLDEQIRAVAFGINNKGLVVGQSGAEVNASESDRAVIWDANEEKPKAEDLGVLQEGHRSVASAINNNDVVVGQSIEPLNGTGGAFFVMDVTKRPLTLQQLPGRGGPDSAKAVNDSGVVVGRLYDNADLQLGFFANITKKTPEVGDLSGDGLGPTTSARGINASNLVVGHIGRVGEDSAHAAYWTFRDPRTPAKPEGAKLLPFLAKGNSIAHDVNDRGNIVGGWLPPPAELSDGRAVIWFYRAPAFGGYAVEDLNLLMDRRFRAKDGKGWVLIEAFAISDKDEIVGRGTLDGKPRGFLMYRRGARPGNCSRVEYADQLDTDEDRVGDACDPDEGNASCTEGADLDGDGVVDVCDNCPDVYNPDQSDLDEDGVGDACESAVDGDEDGDAIIDSTDNCLGVSNPDQRDSDEDGVGDLCELEREDNDGGNVDGGDGEPIGGQPGMCAGDSGFDAAADLDGDGCVDEADLNFAGSPAVITADLNGDDRIDQLDRDLIMAQLGRCNGDLDFNPAADLNRDGCVDGIDLDLCVDTTTLLGVSASAPAVEGDGAPGIVTNELNP